MREFFKHQLETLHARTGLRQLENMMQKETWREDVDMLIRFMIDECEKPPFDIVPAVVKQRVIERAVVEDKDFIGLNARFVKKSLGAWWLANGGRVLEQLEKKSESVYQKVELTQAQKEAVDVLLSSYVKRLLSDEGFKPAPKVRPELMEKEGAERRKFEPYPVTSLSEAKKHELHLEWARQNFDPRTMDKLPTWKPEPEWVASLTEKERNEIESRAL